MNDYEINVVTQFNKDVIEQWDEYGKGFNLSPLQEHTKRLIQLQDQGVRDALKKLGWLSPEDSRELLQCCAAFQDYEAFTPPWVSAEKAFARILKEYPVGGEE